MTTKLTITNATAVQVYTDGGLSAIIDQIEAEVSGLVPNLKTAKGRKEIASMAAKVARSKTKLDSLGKELTADWARQKKAVDSERKDMRERLDALRDKVRLPLTEWEDAEKERVADIKQRIQDFDRGDTDPPSVSEWEAWIKWVESVEIDESFAEFANEAATAKDLALTIARASLITAEASEKAERDREEQAERDRIAREEQIRKEAAEQATRNAEAKARREAEQVEQQRQREQQARKDEEQRKEQQRLDALESERLAKERAATAEANAKRLANEAAERARKQAEQDAQDRKDAEAKAAADRDANIDNRRKVNRAALAAMIVVGLSEADAKAVLTAIVAGKIPHTKVIY